MNKLEKRRRNHRPIEEYDRKALLVKLKKLSYRNGVLKLKIMPLFSVCTICLINDFVDIDDFRIITNSIDDRIEIERIEALGGGMYNIKITDLNSSSLERPSKPFQIILTSFLFDNEMQYFSLPLNFRGKRNKSND